MQYAMARGGFGGRRPAVGLAGCTDSINLVQGMYPPVYPAQYGYAAPMAAMSGPPGWAPSPCGPQAAPMLNVMSAALQCTRNPDGSWSCPPGMAAPAPYPAAPLCQPAFYPLTNPCDELVLPPVNPCDPFSIFCSLFGQRRGLAKTTIGIPITTIPAGQSATITIPVGIFFRPCSLRIPSDIINASLFVTAISSGGNPQIQGPVPARLFSEVAEECVTLKGDPVGFGNSLTITVANQSGSPINFSGAFFGTEFTC